MCTVTRPGLAPIASATAVELLVSLLQHPLGWVLLCLGERCMSESYNHFSSLHAPAPPPGQDPQPQQENEGSVLGLVPHQLRGFLAQFRNMQIVGAAYDRCTGCSETVRRAVLTTSIMISRMFLVVAGHQGVRDGRICHDVESIQRNGVPGEPDGFG